MFRRAILNRCATSSSSSSSSSSLYGGSGRNCWSILRQRSPEFRPPALHVLYDPVKNHRFCEATIDITPASSAAGSNASIIKRKSVNPFLSAEEEKGAPAKKSEGAAAALGPPDSRAAFLVWDGHGETTLNVKHTDAVPFDEKSVALFGFSELCTIPFSDSSASLSSDDLFKLRQLSHATKQLSPTTMMAGGSSNDGVKHLSTVFLTSLDHRAWFAPGQRDVIMRNLDANPQLRIACSEKWHAALASADGLDALIVASTQGIQNKNSKDALLFDKGSKSWSSPRLPADRLVKMSAASADAGSASKSSSSSIKCGRREIKFIAETWCGTPIFHDATTKSLFSSSGLAASLPWMEVLADTHLAGAFRSHPPFLLPFWPNSFTATSSSSSSSAALEASSINNRVFAAPRAVALIHHLLHHSPQRIFLERFGMVTPADEFLEKLEAVAEDLYSLQMRLATRIMNLAAASATNNNNNNNDDLSSAAQELSKKVAQRLAEAIFVGSKDGAKEQWESIGEIRKKESESAAVLHDVMKSIEGEINDFMVRPFLSGARRMAIKMQEDDRNRQAERNTESLSPSSSSSSSHDDAASQKAKRGKRAAADDDTKTTAASTSSSSPSELAKMIRERLGTESATAIAIKVKKEEIDGQIFAAMSEAELKSVFGELSFGTLKKLVRFQKSL